MMSSVYEHQSLNNSFSHFFAPAPASEPVAAPASEPVAAPAPEPATTAAPAVSPAAPAAATPAVTPAVVIASDSNAVEQAKLELLAARLRLTELQIEREQKNRQEAELKAQRAKADLRRSELKLQREEQKQKKSATECALSSAPSLSSAALPSVPSAALTLSSSALPSMPVKDPFPEPEKPRTDTPSKQVMAAPSSSTPTPTPASDSLLICDICQARMPTEFDLICDPLTCPHRACEQCVKTYFREERKKNRAPVKCWHSDCQKNFSHRIVRDMFPPAEAGPYEQATLLSAAASSSQ